MNTVIDNLILATGYFESVLNNIDEPVISTNRDFKIIFWNRGAQNHFKFSVKEVIGKEVSSVLRLLYTEKSLNEIKESLAINKKWRGELQYKSKSDQDLMFDVSLSAIEDVSGEVVGYVALHRNITAQKKAESSLLQSLAKEHQLAEMKNRFVMMASHEFRTPMSAILSSSNLIEKYGETEHQPNRLKHINRIKESIHHMNAILEDFLSLSRLEEGKIKAVDSFFNLRALIINIIDELNFIRKENQSISYSHEGESEIKTDKKLLRGIIINLLSNAIKFSEENKNIIIKSSIQNQKVYIEVIDEGMGISNEDQKYIFQSFFRGKNAQCIEGTGLGLHIAKRYAHILKGNIQLNSMVGKGTTVSVLI